MSSIGIGLGVWIWGAVTTVVATGCLAFIARAAFYIDRKGKFKDATPTWIISIYIVLKDHGSLIAGLVGFSALAWAYFFQASHGPEADPRPSCESVPSHRIPAGNDCVDAEIGR